MTTRFENNGKTGDSSSGIAGVVAESFLRETQQREAQQEDQCRRIPQTNSQDTGVKDSKNHETTAGQGERNQQIIIINNCCEGKNSGTINPSKGHRRIHHPVKDKPADKTIEDKSKPEDKLKIEDKSKPACTETPFGPSQTAAAGDMHAKVENFKPHVVNGKISDSFIFNPVRPVGIGGLNPGEAFEGLGEEHFGTDNRVGVQSKTNADCSVTYRYTNAEIETGVFDTAFTGEETIAKDGTLLSAKLSYTSPVSMDLINVRGETLTLTEVTMTESEKQQDGCYKVRVVTKPGDNYFFEVDSDGRVVNMEKK